MAGDEGPKGDDIVPVPMEQVREARGEKVVAVHRSKLASLRPFRRIRADRVLGVLGVVVLAVALVLVFVWENPPEEQPEWPVEWQETEYVPINATTARVEEPGSGTPGGPAPETQQEHTFEVSQPNATRVEISVSWQDDIGNTEGFPAGDEIEVTLIGPDDTNTTITRQLVGNVSETQYINMTVALNPTPALGAAPVETEEAAREYVDANVNETAYGMGQWRVIVRMIEAGDSGDYPQGTDECSPIGQAADQCQIDDGNEYTLTARYFTFYPEFPPPDGS